MVGVKLLLVTWYFPPANTIGAVRMGKFAKYLSRQGYDIRVLTGGDWGLPETLPLEIDPSLVHGARRRDLTEMPGPIAALRDWLKGRGPPGQSQPPPNSAPPNGAAPQV